MRFCSCAGREEPANSLVFSASGWLQAEAHGGRRRPWSPTVGSSTRISGRAECLKINTRHRATQIPPRMTEIERRLLDCGLVACRHMREAPPRCPASFDRCNSIFARVSCSGSRVRFAPEAVMLYRLLFPLDDQRTVMRRRPAPISPRERAEIA
jgi:hypothetical protein